MSEPLTEHSCGLIPPQTAISATFRARLLVVLEALIDTAERTTGSHDVYNLTEYARIPFNEVRDIYQQLKY